MQNYYIILIIVPIVLAVLVVLASKEEPVKMDENTFLLQYGKSLRLFGIGFPLVFFSFIIYAGLKTPPQSNEDIKSFFLLLGMPLLFLIYFYMEFFRVKIIVNNKSIIATTPWRGTQEILWSDIEKVSYSQAFRWLKIRTYNKKTLCISLFITGFDEFIRLMMDNIQIPKYQDALNNMDG